MDGVKCTTSSRVPKTTEIKAPLWEEKAQTSGFFLFPLNSARPLFESGFPKNFIKITEFVDFLLCIFANSSILYVLNSIFSTENLQSL